MEEYTYQLLDGKATAAQMKREMAEEVAQIKAAGGKVPHLAAILVGHDGGSETYVASKVKTCKEIGVCVRVRTRDVYCGREAPGG